MKLFSSLWLPFLLSGSVAAILAVTIEVRRGFHYWLSLIHPLAFPIAGLLSTLEFRAVNSGWSTVGFALWCVLFVLGFVGMFVSTFPFRGRWWLPAAHLVTTFSAFLSMIASVHAH